MRPSKGPVEKKRKKEPTIFFFTSDWAVALNALLPTGWHALFSSSGTEKKKKQERKAKAGAFGGERGASTLSASPERFVVGFWVEPWRFGLQGWREGKQSGKKRQNQKKGEGGQHFRSMHWSGRRPIHPFLPLQEKKMETKERGNQRDVFTRGLPHQATCRALILCMGTPHGLAKDFQCKKGEMY